MTSDKLQSDPALRPIYDALSTSFSQQALRELDPLLDGATSIKQQANHVTIDRASPVTLPMKGNFLNGNIKVTSISVGDVDFDVDGRSQTLSNIHGVNLNLDVFGSQQKVEVNRARIGINSEGKKVLFTDIVNPLPEPAQRIVGMPNTIAVEIPFTNTGLKAPMLSQVFTDAAATTGPSIAGLLASDVLHEASNVSLFVETNPKWVGYVLDPVLHNLVRQIGPLPVSTTTIGRPVVPVAPIQQPGQPGHSPLVNPQPFNPLNPGTFMPKSSNPALDVGDHDVNMTVAGAERHYRVHVPPSYNGQTPMPLVLLLHGLGQDGKEISSWTHMDEVADRKGFIAVYPDSRQWAGRKDWRSWDTDNGLLPPGADADDIHFMRSIIDEAQKDYNIDPKRIYMAGLSNGAMMTFRATPELSDKLAAIATVSGAMSGTEPAPKEPISVLNIHGTEDEIIPYEGLKNEPNSLTAIGLPKFKPTEYTTNYWTEQDKITTPPLIIQDNHVTERRFKDSVTGTEVDEYTIHGGHHVPDNIPQITDTIWNFFEAHPKVAGTTSGTPQPPQTEFNIVERLKDHINARGVQGLEIDTGKMLNEIPNLGDGSFSPSQMINNFESQTGVKLHDGISDFLKSTLTVSKDHNTIAFDLDSAKHISVPVSGKQEAVQLRSVDIDDPSFDVSTQNGLPIFNNIKGVSFDLHAMGRDVKSNVHEISQKLDSNGAPYYRMQTDNPMPSLLRSVMFADSQVPVEFKLDNNGHSYVTNEREIKDAVLGWNPVTRGYIDMGTHAVNFYDKPSIGGGLNISKDLLIMGGSGYGAYRLAALRFGTKGSLATAITVGVLVAPAVIHGIEKLVD